MPQTTDFTERPPCRRHRTRVCVDRSATRGRFYCPAWDRTRNARSKVWSDADFTTGHFIWATYCDSNSSGEPANDMRYNNLRRFV